MRLSSRIYALADQISIGETAADIGTDHGYVPMLLLKNGISPRVIMSDISADSLAKARETFIITGLMDRTPDSDFRVGDGLAAIMPGETDAVIIGGLGGHTITDILRADEAKSKTYPKLVLQPRKHSGTLRYYLYTHGWNIISDILSREGKFACEIITAVPDPEYRADEIRPAPYPEDDIRWKYPGSLIDADPALAAGRIGWKIRSIEEQLESLSHSNTDHSELISRLNEDLAYLRTLCVSKNCPL